MNEVRGLVDDRLTSLIEPITTATEAGTIARGAVIDVRHHGEVMASCGIGTDGLGAPVGPETLFAVYCSAKPLVALAIGQLVDVRELSWDDRLGDVIDEPLAPDLREVTIAQLLTHTAGLHELRAEAMLSRSPSDRREVAHRHVPPVGWDPGAHLAYSNFLGWYWLVRTIEALTGGPASTYISDAVIEPLGLAGEVITGFAPDEAVAAAGRVAVNVDLTGRRPTPMLLERSPTFMTDPDLAATGGYATVRGLRSLYDSLMTVLADSGSDTDGNGLPRHLVETMVDPVVTGRHDPVLGRNGPWGLGFMVDLRHHSFGDHPSPRSFGHSGNAGSSFAFADPAHDLAVAVLYTAKVDDRFAVHVRRHQFVTRLYAALGLGPG